SIYGIDHTHALVALGAGIGVVLATALVARPLLFASIDPDVASARGLPVRALGLVFVTLLAVTVAEAVQIAGALLLLGLVVTPAAAAVRLTTRPFGAMALSALVAVSALWLGLVTNYYAARVPVSFAVVAVAFAVFVGSVVLGAIRGRVGPAQAS
ncbi:MAG TPA: metal ABC transporter permease, partial [Dehalococcoidia bacterium]